MIVDFYQDIVASGLGVSRMLYDKDNGMISQRTLAFTIIGQWTKFDVGGLLDHRSENDLNYFHLELVSVEFMLEMVIYSNCSVNHHNHNWEIIYVMFTAISTSHSVFK